MSRFSSTKRAGSLLALGACLLVAGCAGIEKRGATGRVYIEGSDAILAQAEAVPCDKPIMPSRTAITDFKYGCFCGADHPRVRHVSGKAENDLSAQELRELAVAYLRIKPVDDIDRACQAHDVCWLLRGTGKMSCNVDLSDRMDYLEGVFMKGGKKGWFGPKKRLSEECENLAYDVGSVSGDTTNCPPDDTRN